MAKVEGYHLFAAADRLSETRELWYDAALGLSAQSSYISIRELGITRDQSA